MQEPTIYAQVASHSKPIYVPPPHPYMNRSSDETTAETPLIGHDNKVMAIMTNYFAHIALISLLLRFNESFVAQGFINGGSKLRK